MKTRYRLPRTHKELEAALQQEYYRGWNDAKEQAARETKKDEAVFARQQAQVRLEALKAATQLTSVAGQAVGELVRGMCSEAKQL